MKRKTILGVFAGSAAMVAFALFCALVAPVATYAFAQTSTNKVSTSTFEGSGWEYVSKSDALTASVETIDTSACDEKATKTTEDKVLKITTTEATRGGAKSSSTFTLDKNSFYKLSVLAKTENDATFSFGFSGTVSHSQFVDEKPTVWTEYSFYIASSVEAAQEVSIELWIGDSTNEATTSQGTVFFDDVTLVQIDAASFTTVATAENSHSERNAIDAAQSGASFAVISNWTATKADGEDENQTIEVVSGSLKATNNSEAGDTEKKLSIKSNGFVLPKLGTYRIALSARLESTDTKTITAKLELSNGANKTQTLSLSKPTDESIGSSYTNGYTEIEFFIQTTYLENQTATITLTIPEETTVLFGGFAVSKVTQTTFSGATYKIDSLPDISKGISNGFFTKTNDSKLVAPFTASDWTKSGDTTNATMGIVSDALGSYTVNEQIIVVKTAYQISSEKKESAAITSSTISLTSSTKPTSIISVYVKTADHATITVLSGTTEIAKFENVSTAGAWKEYCVYVKTDESLSLTLKLELAEEETDGSHSVLFANATCVSTTDALISAKKTTALSNEQVYDNTTWTAHTAIKDNGVYSPIDFSATLDTESNAVGGILDLANIDADSDFDSYKDSLKSTSGEKSGEYVAIAHKTAGFSTISHTKKITNTTQGYVKIEAKVLLASVSGKAYISFGDLGTIELTQETDADENGWITCSIFVKTGSNTIGSFETKIALGSEDEKSTGVVLLDEVAATTSTEKAYLEAQNSENGTLSTKDLSSNSTKEDTTTSNKKSLSNNPTAIFFIALSSLLLVGIVIFVVIVYGVKHLPKRTRVNIQVHSNPKPRKTKKTGSSSSESSDKGFV